MNDKIFDKDYLSIGEFAELSGLSVTTLRHYHKVGALFPAKLDPENGYRYYSSTQIVVIKMILVLTGIGVSLDTISDLAQNRTPEILLKVLRKNKDIVAEKLRFYQDAYSAINTYTELLYEGISISETELAMYEMPERHILLGDLNDYNGTEGFAREFTRFCSGEHEPKLNMSYPMGGYWESMAAFLDEPSRPPRFYSLDPKGLELKPAGTYLVGYTRGYYGTTNDLPKKMETFAQMNELMFTGPVYGQYLFDELSETDPDRYLMQVSASVKGITRTSARRMQYF